MKCCLILATAWSENYWNSDKEAPYPGTTYTDLSEWEILSRNCPLPGIGRYIKQRDKDFYKKPFVYLKITGMRYDPSSLKPYFDFKTIEISKTESRKLENLLPSNKRKLFSCVDVNQILDILQELEESPPSEWIELTDAGRKMIDWCDYIGNYFLQIRDNTISNDEFEDRVAALLKALGFKVNQKGHTLVGEFPDGIASLNNDYAIVYDCKNINNYLPALDDERALNKYLKDEKLIRREEKIYCSFVAKSFRKKGKKDILYIPLNSLLYLLYKKLLMGPSFDLSPLKKVFDNFMELNKETIDNEWRSY